MIRINVAILNTEMLWFYVLLAGVRGQGDVLCKNEGMIFVFIWIYFLL